MTVIDQQSSSGPTASDAQLLEDELKALEVLLDPLLLSYRKHHPKASTKRIVDAFRLGARAHSTQKRKSGEPYITHPVAVATVLAELGLDDITLAAAILHDAVEDTGVTLDDLVGQFGAEVAQIVDGVTKLERLQFDSKEAQQAATMRKMLVAMAKDIRVLLIKLADRLHNMRTIDAVSEDWKRRRTAQETLDIYSPLAHRLGIGGIKHELEDLSFRALEPRKYTELKSMVDNRAPERERFLAIAIDELKERLTELRIDAVVTGREKHLWSIYEKMMVKGKDFGEIHDLMGIRVVVESVKDCYAALGSIHAAYKPVQGRFKDYIAMPKFNLYQSLHTTVVGPEGKVLEFQVRTREMNQRAEWGVAAHWGYKEEGRTGRIDATDMAWLQRISESAIGDQSEPSEYLASLKGDLDQDEVVVFSPKGKVVTLPVGANPIDFAYAIHTDIGHRCIGARINGRLVPLDTKIGSGETVDIITSKVETAQPSRDWLQIVVTPRAKAKIKQWFSKERRDDALDNGRDELFRVMRKDGLPTQKLVDTPVLAAVVESLGFADLAALFVSIGEGHTGAQGVAQRLARELRGGEHEEQLPAEPIRARPRERRRARGRDGVGIHVEGLEDVLVRLSRCCTPVPGDEIVGFVTRGRGVSVHRSDCANSNSLKTGAGGRMIEVEWDGSDSKVKGFVVSIMVESLDRARLLADVAGVLSDKHVNVLGCTTHTGSDRVARQRFDFELADPSHLEAVIAAVRRVESVFDVKRMMPGKKTPANA